MAASPKTPSMLQLESNNKDADKLAYEIFSILENKFLFGYDDTKLSSKQQEHMMSSPSPNKYITNNGKVRILSIDAGGATDGVLAAKSLAHLEATLCMKSGNKNAHISDFFDAVAGAGVGGILATLLFTRGKDGNPMFTAEKALKFIIENGRKIYRPSSAGLFRRSQRPLKLFKKVFGELTLKDTVKAVLVPCYDLGTGAPFLFSRADALEMDGCDFKMSDVCGATLADRPVEVRSVDGRRKIVAVGGGVAMNNPTAAAITHVVNNKHEFPLCKGVEDLLVVSLGNGESDLAAGNFQSSPAAFVKIVGDGAADMVDQGVSMAFSQSRSNNYVRIQGNGLILNKKHYTEKDNKKDLLTIAEEMLKQKNVESLLFQGKRLAQSTNLTKLENFANVLIMEQERRKTSILPPVVLKQASPSPRTSSATTLSTASSNNGWGIGDEQRQIGGQGEKESQTFADEANDNLR
ncbi:hypothetical protein LIER_22330 [Lithospermum erythrorhizon]|uniref:Patatin n=1 Tax=Lithospermum erythrorhizon TaxID=34254 RepID=A0AAV3QV14_LITER